MFRGAIFNTVRAVHRQGVRGVENFLAIDHQAISEAAFIQRFSQPYSVKLLGLAGRWRIKQHLFDQHHGALFPLVDAFRSRSGPDAEDYQWLMHQARPALSVDEARLDGYWLRIDSLQSNALVLYEFSSGADPAP